MNATKPCGTKTHCPSATHTAAPLASAVVALSFALVSAAAAQPAEAPASPEDDPTEVQAEDETSSDEPTQTPTTEAETSAPSGDDQAKLDAAELKSEAAPSPEGDIAASPLVASGDGSSARQTTETTFARYSSEDAAEYDPWRYAEPASRRKRKGRYGLGITYSMMQPVGRTHTFAGGFSGRGFAFEGRYFLTQALSLGAITGWSSADTKENSTFVQDNITLNTTVIRELRTSPIMAALHYYFDAANGWVSPFVGLALGTLWTERFVNFGFTSTVDSNWHFAYAPELGVMLNPGHTSFLLSTRFNHAVQAPNAPNEYWFTFNVGIMIL